MVVGERVGLACLIQSSTLILSRDPCPCQSVLGGLYQDEILSLFAGSVKQLAAAWTTILLQFGNIALVPRSQCLLPPPPPLPPLPPPPPPPLHPPPLFLLAIATRGVEFCFMMRLNCLHWALSSMRSRAAGSGLSRVGVRSLATYSCAAAIYSTRLSM
jgi:hypothetical protein